MNCQHENWGLSHIINHCYPDKLIEKKKENSSEVTPFKNIPQIKWEKLNVTNNYTCYHFKECKHIL